MKLYVYCLAGHIDPPAVPVSGISGTRVEVIRIEDLSLLVSEASEFDGDAVPVTRDNALAHAAVVRSILNETTPLPFRFGTIVSDELLRGYVTSHRESLKAKLAHVHGCVEMSVKIISDRSRTDGDDAAELNEQGPGARFLKEKRREILGGEHRAEQAREVAAWLHDEVRELIRDKEVRLCPTERLIVAAAHLVPRAEIPTYHERLAEARNMRPELHFLLSGPWPPYSFSNIELEFKTRFGVS